MTENYTTSQKNAKDKINAGNNILLTGKPGTGKTELLRNVCRELSAQGKQVAVTGSTGMAAANFDGGRTIHSVLGWRPDTHDFDYDYCAEKIKNIDVLVIDEVSMLTTAIINHMAKCLEKLDHKPQLILSGDFFQLPPVRDFCYPFENPYWESFNLQPCILNEVVRQREADYLAMLDKARYSDVSCVEYFNTQSYGKRIEGGIGLCTVNDLADQINDRYFNGLSGPFKSYEALGDLEDADLKGFSIKKTLKIKKNMRVMSLRNDSNYKYQNGSLGTVIDMDENTIRVYFDNDNVEDIGRIDYVVNSRNVDKDVVHLKQFPLKAGYAITIHKSQGQTFDSVNINAPRCWDPGQLYVALSRARHITGIHLMVPITAGSLITDYRVVKYYEELYKRCA